MEFISMEKREQGKYITRYDLLYKTVDNKEKRYEMISRDSNMESFEDLHDRGADAIVIICHDETKEKILINKEFRLAVGEWVYNFPAGLIDPGATPEEAARRELWEETGLHIDTIEEVLGESYSAVGFSNEKNLCIVGTASGTFRESTSTVEEIEAKWVTREEMRKLLKTERFAARSQAYCYLWSKEK